VIHRWSIGGAMPTDRLVYREFPIGLWRADLVVIWPGRLLVVEFKRDTADEEAVAQACRYAGSIQAKGTDSSFRGVANLVAIVATRFTERALAAASGAGATCFTMTTVGESVQLLPADTPLGIDLPEAATDLIYRPIYDDLRANGVIA
jgi:hypothetical protein